MSARRKGSGGKEKGDGGKEKGDASIHVERLRALEADYAAQREMLARLAEAAEFRGGGTGFHAHRVGRLAGGIARLIGLPEDEAELIEHAAPLHDVGNLSIPESILLKRGALTPAEIEVMKTHTLAGARLLSGGLSPLMSLAERICLLHHERWDGSGYPAGLRGDENPPFARIVWVADVVDVLAHSRPYRAAWPLDLVIAELKNQRGKKFDPITVDACLELLAAPDGRERWIDDPVGAAPITLGPPPAGRRR